MSQNKFISDFKKELEKVQNKQYLIENEIIQIEVFLNSKKHVSSDLYSTIQNFSVQEEIRVFDSSNFDGFEVSEMFHEYMLTNKITFETVFNIDTEAIKNTVKEFAEYYLWLKEILKNSSKVNYKPTLSHKQKMLALFYLGLDFRGYNNNVKSAKILSEILGLDNDNTRKIIPKLYFNSKGNNVRTKDNLKKLLKLFDYEEFDDISKKINEDLNNLN